MTSVGFIGLGIMGGPMAANLVKAGFDVVGYNRSRAKVDRLVEAGGRGAASPSEAIRDRGIGAEHSTDFLWTEGLDKPPVLVWHHPSVSRMRQRYATVNDGSAEFFMLKHAT